VSAWTYLSFDEAVEDASGGNVKTKQNDYAEQGSFAIVDQGKALIAGYTDDPLALCRAGLPVVVFGDHTRCLKYVDFPFGMGADGVKILRPRAELDVKFLYHYLRQLKLPDGGYDRHFKYLKRESVPTPPLEEQHRIAAILDQAEILRTQRRQALAHLDTLTQSLFLDMFGDPVTNPKGWETKPASALGKVITGNTPPRAVPEYYGNSIEWIKSDNLNTPHYYLTNASERLSEAGKAVGRAVPPNSILVTCIAGSPECIGNAAMADREVAFNQQINAFIPSKLDAHFAYAQIVVGKKLIQSASTNGMKGMVSKSRFEAIEFMVPPLPLQQTFATRIAAIEALKTTHRTALAQLDALFASLQQRAFAGEL
jgi:type I restriction enzyme, S subunit